MPVSKPASVFQIRRRRPPPTKESLGLIIAELLPEVVQVRRSAPAGPRTANRLNRLLAPPGFDRILRSKQRGLHHSFSAAPGPRGREMRVSAANCGETLVASWRRVGGGFHPKGGSVRFGFARTAPSLAGHCRGPKDFTRESRAGAATRTGSNLCSPAAAGGQPDRNHRTSTVLGAHRRSGMGAFLVWQ